MTIEVRPPHSLTRSTFSLLLALVLTVVIWNGVAHAQESGPPPWPILFSGTATFDGASIERGRITVRVGDWESAPANVADGTFGCCLLAGPPSGRYVGETISFHLDGQYEAELMLEFSAAAAPAERVVVLAFAGDRLSPTATPSPVPTAVATATPIARINAGPTVTPIPVGLEDETGVTALVLIVVIVGGGIGLVAAAGLGAWRLYHRS